MTPPVLAPAVWFPASREQFITAQHHEAWRVRMPLRRHLDRRKKFTRDEKDDFRRHHEYRCECGSTSLLQIDHIVPQILGGSSRDANLKYRCGPCNRAAWRVFDPYLRAYDAYLADVAA